MGGLDGAESSLWDQPLGEGRGHNLAGPGLFLAARVSWFYHVPDDTKMKLPSY